jgi:predicted HD phosphohydrolase
MVKHHGIFQGYYFFHYLGKDRNVRDQFKDHEHFNYTAEFCHKYDQKAFDPEFTAMPLEDFVPMVERVFAQPKTSLYI